MQTHTPGPWIQGAERVGRQTTHYVKIGTSNAYTQRGVGMTEETVIANARLIAAAPELLEALLAMLDRANMSHPYFEQTSIAARDLARTAIAKATNA